MKFERVLVLGGSIGGLLAAAALSEHFREVVIVDRDELLVEGEAARMPRRGVPQGDQVHHLLLLGRDVIEELVGGVDDALLAEGSRHYDPAADFAQFTSGRWLVRARSDLTITCFRRPVFEWVIRRSVLSLPNVTVHQGMALGLTASPDGSRVTGARVKNAPDARIDADLVVDATGRGSRSPLWLEDLGYERPEEAHLRIYMGYSSFHIELGYELPDGLAGITCSSSPGAAMPGGAALRPTDNGRFMVIASGVMRQYPPTTMDEMLCFLRSMPTPVLADAVEHGSPLSAISSYQMAGNQRRYWERLERRPEGFVVLGDAVASFNPVYGQGMTTAAVGARTLRDVVASADSIDGVASAFQNALAPWVDIAFENALAVDASVPGAEFENIDPPSDVDPGFRRALAEIQSEDVDVMLAVRRATLYLSPGELLRSDIQDRVAQWISSNASVRPEVRDPLRLPRLV